MSLSQDRGYGASKLCTNEISGPFRTARTELHYGFGNRTVSLENLLAEKPSVTHFFATPQTWPACSMFGGEKRVANCATCAYCPVQHFSEVP